eukprot:Skav232381  [mRNA]  locus=scaffold1077:200978:203391:- [translate_table: standard]
MASLLCPHCFRLKALGMPPAEEAVCNKCKQGKPSAGDSWCIGCSALESCQQSLRLSWNYPGLRQVTEELLLTGARLSKAFSKLDRALCAEQETLAPAAASKARARDHRSRSPRRDEERPRSRAPPKPPSPPRRSEREREPLPTGDTEESEEGSEEEEVVEDEEVEKPRDEKAGVRAVVRGTDRPAEPARGPRKPEERRKKKKKKVRRGGAKHQRRWREKDDPLRRSHRRENLGGSDGPLDGLGLSEEDIAVMEEEERQAEKREFLRRLQAEREKRPPPSGPIAYSVEEAAFWEQRYIPLGSVLSYASVQPDGTIDGEVAVLVQQIEHDSEGVSIQVSFVGCELVSARARLQKFFRGGKKRVHICYLTGGVCTADSKGDVHLKQFEWHAPGEFTRDWLTNSGKKLVKDGLVLASKAAEHTGEPPHHERERSAVENRLSALKKKADKRVTYAQGTALGERKSRAGTLRDTPGDGVLAVGGGPPPAATPKIKAKAEVIAIDSDDGVTPRRTGGSNLGVALAKAVDARQKKASRAKKRSRSRSKKRRKKRSRRRRSSGSPSDPSGEESSSSSDSLIPPLKKKSKRDPGSVFKMLEAQATEHLAQESLLEEDDASVRNRPRMYSYYQLGLRPHLDPKSRDNREISFLARGLDLLKEGKLPELADHMAARLIAVNTASSQGWSVAQSLEIHQGEEDGPAPAHILLQAHRHTRQIEKAGGKGSWSSYGRWKGDWGGDNTWKGSGKGTKGKGKKGKSKGKGGKPWGTYEKEKGADPSPKTGEK